LKKGRHNGKRLGIRVRVPIEIVDRRDDVVSAEAYGRCWGVGGENGVDIQAALERLSGYRFPRPVESTMIAL